MKILSISSILPVPGIINNNDFVFQTYQHYLELNKDDTVVIIKPVKYDLNPVKIFKHSTTLSRIRKNPQPNIRNFQVEIFPFFSSWSFRNLHALITQTIYFLNRKRIDRLFSRYNFDVIHAQYIFSDGILAYRLSKKYTIPYFITTHNERFYFDKKKKKKIALKILSNASVVLPINFTNYSYFKKSGLTNITLTPLGFNKSFLREQKTGQNKIVSILTVAELIKLKNIDKVILAIKNLVSKYNISYTIIGKGPERENLEKLVEQHHLDNFVRFMGSIPHDQIAGEMYRHDIFIMPSYFETFGRVYFEAMAMGIPVICAKNSGIDGIFKDMEEGIAVNHSDIHEITGALEFLISNPEERIRIGKNGKKLVEHYTWENIARDLQSKYLKVVKKNRLK